MPNEKFFPIIESLHEHIGSEEPLPVIYALSKILLANPEFPEELSAKKLKIDKEEVNSLKEVKEGFYSSLVYFCQTETVCNFIQKNNLGNEILFDQDGNALGNPTIDDGDIFAVINFLHSKIGGYSNEKFFISETNGFSLVPELKIYKHCSILDLRDFIVKEKADHTFVRIFKLTSLSIDNIKKAYDTIKKSIEQKKWGNHHYEGNGVPSHRNCHAYIYNLLRIAQNNKEIIKASENTNEEVYNEPNMGTGSAPNKTW